MEPRQCKDEVHLPLKCASSPSQKNKIIKNNIYIFLKIYIHCFSPNTT